MPIVFGEIYGSSEGGFRKAGEHTAAALLPCALTAKSASAARMVSHKGCSDSMFLVKVTPCTAPGGWSSITCNGPAPMEEDVLPVLPLVTAHLQEADGGFSLSVLFAFPSPTASGFDIGVTAALSVTSTSSVHISFFFFFSPYVFPFSSPANRLHCWFGIQSIRS